MALYTTPDGRVVIGTGVSDGNDYHGYNGKRDIVIQLTADGATDDGLNALEYLKAYATNAKAENKPIFPDGTRVFISTNGYTKAVEADDVVIDGDNITIGGIAWDGSAWDFSNAGQPGGGGQLPTPTAQDIGKVATVVEESGSPTWGMAAGGGVLVVNGSLEGTTLTLDKTWQEIADADLAVLKFASDDTTEVDTLSAFGSTETSSGGTAEVTYWVHFGGSAGGLPDLVTSSADGYPSVTLK